MFLDPINIQKKLFQNLFVYQKEKNHGIIFSSEKIKFYVSCVHGDGNHRRSFLYIDDVTRAFDIILHKGSVGEIYNIGTNFEISNLELAKKLIKKFGLEVIFFLYYVNEIFRIEKKN